MKYYNRKTIKIITKPATAVVSTSDMKDYLRVDTSDDDSLIDGFIEASSVMHRNYLKRSLITETLELTMDGFGSLETDGDERLANLGAGTHIASVPYVLGTGNSVELPFAPVQSITSLKYFDRDNTEATYSSSKYELDEEGGRLYLNEGETWPSNLRNREAVKIRYVSGYGDAASDIPAPIVQSIKMHVGKMYDCREACGMTESCKTLIAQYKLIDYLGFA
jgi:hypothetical protein